jgi:uroporphyrinogen decarboxylase
MTGKERVHAIIDRKSDHCGFWHGSPHSDSAKTLYPHFQVKSDFELGLRLGAICRFVSPEGNGMWQRTDYPMFDPLNKKEHTDAERRSHGQAGVFAECENVEEINAYHWPTVEDCDFTRTLAEIDKTVAAGQAVLSGTWGSIFSNTWSFFGIENCFVKMYTDPEQVEAVTRRLAEFYLAANEKLFALAGDRIDALFIGIDLGSQLDLLISPEGIDRFLLPYIKEFVNQAHRHGYCLVLHSCGSIYRVIPRLIEAGVAVLHPIQAMAKNMDAETLRQYRDKLVFMGGVDTQRLLPFGSAVEVREEVRRLRRLFGPNYIVSPSHETLLPNVPVENVVAMAEAAME